jgi:hypothetical protein
MYPFLSPSLIYLSGKWTLAATFVGLCPPLTVPIVHPSKDLNQLIDFSKISKTHTSHDVMNMSNYAPQNMKRIL